MSIFRLMTVFIFLLAMPALKAQDRHTYYIVRHAEKDTGSNPALSAEGRQRARDLYDALKQKKIDLVFVSQFRRTGMTADSLRVYQHIDTVHYKADTNGDDLFKIIGERAGAAKNILIVGHSNTVPAIVRKAGAKDYLVKELGDDEYDKLFIVSQKKNKTCLKIKKYGKFSLIKTGDHRMNILQ